MSFKTIATLLLLSSLGASVNGGSEEPLQEEGVKEETQIVPFVITDIKLDVTETSATLQLCAADLPAGSPRLSYGSLSPGASQTIVEGSRGVGDLTCAIFMMDPSFTLSDVTTRYELLVIDPGTTNVGRCVSTFAMTAKTTLLACGSEKFTKVTWGDPTPINIQTCLDTDSALLAEDVCYHKGDVWTKDFCVRIKDEEEATIIICMNGLSSAVVTEGLVSTNYFYYGTDAVNNGPGKATLSLNIVTAGLTHSRAIVRLVDAAGVRGDATVYDCPNNECTSDGYTRRFAKYEVCVEALDDNKVTQETATTTFTDLNLHVFDGGSQKSSLMEFVFANGWESTTYSASYSIIEPAAGALGPALSDTVNVDCTAVAPGHACIGYLNTGTHMGTVYLALTEQTGMNTIVTPYVIQ